MESDLSELSSIEDESIYVQPHYRESYRLAIYALLCGGVDAYEEYLQAEQVSHFLSDEEIRFILENAELPAVDEDSGNADRVSSSTYYPTESDEEIPELDLGWPKVRQDGAETSISLLFHPPRQNTPTIKEVVRKQIQVAQKLVAIAMDVFTDVDIFKELISAALRGVMVYVLLDDSRVSSFLNMSRSMGINLHDIKSLRVRTVQGDQYQCRSSAKFHGGLDQRFILLDLQTVLYGTYSYTWSFEKINLSMVLVITGQLVSSYDEEFRRLYARSVIPEALDTGSLTSTYPKSSQLSLNLHMKSRPNMRGSINDTYNDAATLNRGFSVQEMLHQSHFTDTGSLMRGHRYGGDLQKLNSMRRLRMGTKNLGIPPRHSRDVQPPNRASQQHLRHQTRYGTDHNLIPFNSETSLNKWKMNTYLTESGIPPDAEPPVSSPHSSQMGLNEYQSQMIHSRSMNIKSRMEEMRRKRLSLQEHANLRQSQESLRSLQSTTERPQHMRAHHGRPRGVEINPNTQNNLSLKDNELFKESDRTEQSFMDSKHSASPGNIKMGADRKTMHNCAPAGTQPDTGLDSKLSESTLKISSLISGSLRHSRVMESLTEMPEEKEPLNPPGDLFESALRDKNEMRSKDEKVVQGEHLMKSSLPVESNHHHKAGESYGSIQNKIDSPPPREANKFLHVSSAESGPSAEPQRVTTKKEHTQKEFTDKEKKISRKEKRSLLKSQNSSDSNLSLQTDLSKTSSLGRLNKKDPSTETSQQQNSLSGLSETEKRTEKQKSRFSKLSSQRSSKRKTTPSADQDQGSTGALDNEAASDSQVKRERVYSRYELLIGNDNIHLDKPRRSTKSSDKVKSLSLTRRGDDLRTHQTQGGADNKLGRLMQRMGNLINKNK
ncbi:PREDICTED: protein FAM83B-like [Poecilia mexicana]|uniref:Scaffolding anchor of CK1 domain-containing protein n=1 Tax=Poecilia mexicana TaxID=48701 RepID=A0A3B3Y7G3_9TELE|nr:PREDICTED: protein FAM83B-like [Poecilia mexicana]